jgi:hypothetical protein
MKMLITMLIALGAVAAQTTNLSKVEESSKLFLGALEGALDSTTTVGYLPGYGLYIGLIAFADTEEILPKITQVISLVGGTITGLGATETVNVSYGNDGLAKKLLVRFKPGGAIEIFIGAIRQP